MSTRFYSDVWPGCNPPAERSCKCDDQSNFLRQPMPASNSEEVSPVPSIRRVLFSLRLRALRKPVRRCQGILFNTTGSGANPTMSAIQLR